MVFDVTLECRRLGLRAGAILFHDVRVGPRPEELQQEITRGIETTRARFTVLSSARSAPAVVAFLDVLRRVGVNPRKVQHSVEKLLSYAFKRGDLPAINSLVDTYNLVSLRTLCSLGAHDFDKISPAVQLRILTGQETFIPLGRTEPKEVRPGEFGYVDAENRLLCRLDVLQADFSKVTPATTNALLIVEATWNHAPEILREAFDLALRWVPQFCGGMGKVVAWPDE